MEFVDLVIARRQLLFEVFVSSVNVRHRGERHRVPASSDGEVDGRNGDG